MWEPSSTRIETGSIVEARGLAKRYARGATALETADLRMGPGEKVGLIGANGSGKTTLLRILAGLLRPDGGEASVFGQPPETREARSRVGYVAQETSLDPDMTVGETLRLFATLHGLAGARGAGAIAEAVKIFGLESWRDKRVEACSGGMRQRLSLALGFLPRPDLLLLDEPESGLDPAGRRALHLWLDSHVERGGTVLLSLHDLREAAERCTRIVLLAAGQVGADGTPQALISRYGFETWTATLGRAFPDQGALDLRLAALPAVQRVEWGEGEFTIRMGAGAPDDGALLELLKEAGLAVQAYQRRRPDLASVYRALTGGSAPAARAGGRRGGGRNHGGR